MHETSRETLARSHAKGVSSSDMSPRYQDLSRFRVPPGFRGRSSVFLLMWQFVQATLFRWSPQPLYGWRRGLLRLFGAKVGPSVIVRATARIAYPWKVEIGAGAWVGDFVDLYSLDRIFIGANAVISQRSYLCTASHDMEDQNFSYLTAPIRIEDEAWVAADVFVAPGVTIGLGSVVGARSSVFGDIPSGMVAYGSPASVRRARLYDAIAPLPPSKSGVL